MNHLPTIGASRGSSEHPGRPAILLRGGGLLAFVLVSVLLATGPLRTAVSDQSFSTYASAGGLGALALLGALLLADVRRARALALQGVPAGRIEIGLFGSRLLGRGEPTTATAMRAYAWAGPRALAASAAVAGALGGLASLGSGAAPGLLAATGLWVAAALLLFTVLDLVPTPGTPGGMLLQARALRRGASGPASRMRVAVAGVRVGWVLLVAGAASLLLLGFAGLWLMILGGMSLASSRLLLARMKVVEAVSGLTAADVMSPLPPTVHVWLPVSEALSDVAMPNRATVLIAVDSDGSYAGLVPLAALAAVPAEERDTVRVSRVLLPASATATALARDPVEALLDGSAAGPSGPAFATAGQGAAAAMGMPMLGGFLVVLDPEDARHAVGVIGPQDLQRAMLMAPLRTGRGAAGGAGIRTGTVNDTGTGTGVQR